MSAGWSAENAKRAYLQALKMAKRGKEPDVSEFISALAAGKNARFMVAVCAGAAGSTTLALAAAARQTGGRVVCICRSPNEQQASRKALGAYGESVEFVVGDAKTLLSGEYRGSDFVLVDCDMTNAREVFMAALKGAKKDDNRALVVGFNVRHRVSKWRQMKASFLPIGEGLLVTKVDSNNNIVKSLEKVEQRRKSHWIVKVDKCTGEEHIFRVTSPNKKLQIEV
ncbi:hypothetical protein PIB30_064464 [Stylosanthes scabra]|uniref:S-adenosyl-L-methionine-dependent methyltransferase n=1 Tax=Stylosanthes scabra TaxID=79078 RepID=A0ABU6VMP1_9FABA|nr:hypothetical protein [Stylosanthes scabra]